MSSGELHEPVFEAYREYVERGMQAVAIPELAPIDELRRDLVAYGAEVLGVPPGEPAEWLNHVHTHLAKPEDLNALRVKMIQFLNRTPRYRGAIYRAFRPILDDSVGPDIAIQKRINLVVQMPDYEPEELHIHSDVEGGNSPFEVTLWIPLTDSFGTKSMYILDRTVAQSVMQAMTKHKAENLRELMQKLVSPSSYLDMPYGRALLFNPFLLHGNTVNTTKETRFTLNVRVKGMFTPYGAKTFLDYFEPVRLSPASVLGLEYERARSE